MACATGYLCSLNAQGTATAQVAVPAGANHLAVVRGGEAVAEVLGACPDGSVLALGRQPDILACYRLDSEAQCVAVMNAAWRQAVVACHDGSVTALARD